MQRTFPTRRTFNVRGQLLGKLGEDCYAALLSRLEGLTVAAVERPKRRRRRGPRKPVIA